MSEQLFRLPKKSETVRFDNEVLSELDNSLEIFRGHDLEVIKVEPYGEYYYRVSCRDTTRPSSIAKATINKSGYIFGPGEIAVLQQLPVFWLIKGETIWCECENPNLVLNSVAGFTFQYCRKCKKERSP